MIAFFEELIGSGISDYPFLVATLAIIPACIVFFMFYNIFYDLVRFR